MRAILALILLPTLLAALSPEPLHGRHGWSFRNEGDTSR